VPRRENAELYTKYKALADQTPGVHFVGRLATYKYYNMDQIVAQALTVYSKLSGAAKRVESTLRVADKPKVAVAAARARTRKAKVAAGAAETTPLVTVTNLSRTMKLLKEAGLWIAGADMAGEKLAYEADLAGPLALVLGSEGEGLRDLTRKNCDFLVRLPQAGSVESLNV
jgi:hypothetical protein